MITMMDDGFCFIMTMITMMCSSSKATWPPLATRWWNYSALRFTALVRLTHIQPHLNSYQVGACFNSGVIGVNCYCTNQIAGRDLYDCCSMMGNDVETVLRCISTFSRLSTHVARIEWTVLCIYNIASRDCKRQQSYLSQAFQSKWSHHILMILIGSL